MFDRDDLQLRTGSLRQIYEITELPIEVWLVDGEIRRLRYAFAREKALYGGPDRTTTTYDWIPASDQLPIELPG